MSDKDLRERLARRLCSFTCPSGRACTTCGPGHFEEQYGRVDALKAELEPDYAVVKRSTIEHALDNLKFRVTGSDPKLNAYHYAEIPDWQLKQWLAATKENAE